MNAEENKMRRTKKDLMKIFNRFCTAMGKEPYESLKEFIDSSKSSDIGSWRLDYIGCYGGYCIEEIENDKGEISHPLTGNRLPLSEMYDALHLATLALEYKNIRDVK